MKDKIFSQFLENKEKELEEKSKKRLKKKKQKVKISGKGVFDLAKIIKKKSKK